jgi:hypothetical protein
MKETKEVPTIAASELVVDGVYFSAQQHLIQVKKIDIELKELHLFNISEQTNYYKIRFDRHSLVKRIR